MSTSQSQGKKRKAPDQSKAGKKKSKQDDELLPQVMYARTRLYKPTSVPETATHLHLENADGFSFAHAKDKHDMMPVGKYDKDNVERIPRTVAIEILEKCHQFIWIKFIKADGSERKMYAHIVEAGKMLLELKDLQLGAPDKERRRCRYDRIVCFIAYNTLYIVK